jgi:hypothetical protein
MEDSCYLCRRTQVDLDRLNEEIRTRVYLRYFSNARSQIDEQRRRSMFLQRLRDEESGNPHFRINAHQVFGDPEAYQKLMPWIGTLLEIASSGGRRIDERLTIGELVAQLAAEEHEAASRMDEGLNRIREGFPTDRRTPLGLEPVTLELPADWSVAGLPFRWRAASVQDREPMSQPPGGDPPTVEVTVQLCTACRALMRRT